LNGEDEELTSILSTFPFLMNWRDEQGKPPLHYAIEGNHLSTCELLLDLGADMFLDGLVNNEFNLTFIFSIKLVWKIFYIFLSYSI